MKKLYFLVLLVLICGASLRAQFSSSATPTEIRLTILQRETAPFYRKPSDKELKTVAPRRELVDKYAEFLRRPNTGLTKLIDDKGCAKSTKVISATENCLKYSMPGGGSSFSFRTENYRIPRLSDITFTEKSFQAMGVLLHGIFVNLGNVPLEDITLQSNGLKYLVDFQPQTDFKKSKEIDLQLIRGLRRDGFLYRRGLFVAEDSTFALRSIAYGGKNFRAVRGITYNEFEFDKRGDVIVVFRIVEKDAEGNITILWKSLQEKDSPKIKIERPVRKKKL